MRPGEDTDWSRVEHLLLRAETLLHAAADTLERRREERQQERARIAGGLDDLQRPLAQLRLELISLVEQMAAEGSQGSSMSWQGRLQQQLPPLERVQIELERLLLHVADPPSSVDGEGIHPRLVHLEWQKLLEQRNHQVIELRGEVQRLEGILRAAGLSSAASQERGSR